MSLGCGTAVFMLTCRAIGTGPAAGADIVAGACVLYVTCNFVVFRAQRSRPGHQSGTRDRLAGPGGDVMSGTLVASPGTWDGVTVVMPAYREEANLAGTVDDMLGTLAGIGEQHVVVIVNDGSSDRTGEIADDLAARHPGRVRVVHHEVNKGYGAAMRTGIAAALEQTDSAWLFLTDSDGQFRGEQLPEFLAAARTERADAVIGFRPRRADPMMRKINAWLWTQASRILLGVGVRDIDCAYKLIGRRVLDGVALYGDAALISPEILMRIQGRGARILQRPVSHYPRLHGEQTGAKLSVILLSLVGLLGLWRERVNGMLPRRMLRAVTRPRTSLIPRASATRDADRHDTAHRARPGYHGLKGARPWSNRRRRPPRNSPVPRGRRRRKIRPGPFWMVRPEGGGGPPVAQPRS